MLILKTITKLYFKGGKERKCAIISYLHLIVYQMRKLRTIDDVLSFIKKEDPESAVTRFLISKVVLEKDIFKLKTGNKILVDLEEVLKTLGLYED